MVVLYSHQIDFTKPNDKKSSLDGYSTESPVLVRWVDISLDEDGLGLG